MKPPPFPEDEPQRLAALRELDVLDTPPEARFDRVTRLALRLFQVPIALVSLVDAERQWFKSAQGLEVTESPRDISFCGHAILEEDIFVVSNALEDERFSDNPLVCGGQGLRFYAGAPLHSPSGHRVGTLCIIDRQPRAFPEEDQKHLRDLADCVEAELERTHLHVLAARERPLAMVVEHTIHGVAISDPNGFLEWVNPGFQQITGYTLEEAAGWSPGTLLQGPDTDPATVAYMGAQLRAGEPFHVEVINYRKDGDPYWADLSVQPVRNNRGAIIHFAAIVQDITQRKLIERRIAEAEQQLRAVVENVVDGIVTVNERGIILSANAAATRIFGYERKEMVGQNVSILMPEPHCSAHDRYLRNYLQTGVRKMIGQDREMAGRRKNGETFPLELSISELYLDGQRMFSGLVRDITERKRLERLKSEFVSTVSHELRTPLTAIRGALSLMLKKDGADLPERVRHMMEMAARNSERLTVLINDLLDLEKIEGGKLSFEFRALDLVSLAVRAGEDNDAYARKHGVDLVVDTRGLSALVRGDAHRLLQVFANLISNAVKYSPAGGVVTVSLEALPGRFKVSVADQGPGIPEHFHDRIFQRFAQADGSDSREKGGTGLGLSITKAILDHHQGRIGFTSAPGEGATFFFELPALLELEESEEASGRRILICEDDADWAHILHRMVKEEGFIADIAATAKAARTLLQRHRYDLMFLDLTLPDESGLDLLASIRERPATADLPVLVVSGSAREGQVMSPDNPLAVADWLQKPLDQGRLSRALQSVFNRKGRPRVLHLEDDSDLAELVKSVLGEEVDYRAVATCQEARECLASERWDLLLLDLELPDGCGIKLLPHVPSHCQVIIFSARTPDQDVSSKVASSLAKSAATSDQLLAAVRAAIQRGRIEP